MTTKIHIVFNGLVRQFISFFYFTFIKYMSAEIKKNVSQILILIR